MPHMLESLTHASKATKVDDQSTVRIPPEKTAGGTYKGNKASETQITDVDPAHSLALPEAGWQQ